MEILNYGASADESKIYLYVRLYIHIFKYLCPCLRYIGVRLFARSALNSSATSLDTLHNRAGTVMFK